MGFWDMLGQALETGAQALANSTSEALSKQGVTARQLMIEHCELQLYFLSCDKEDKNTEEYRDKKSRKNFIEGILKARGYLPITIYMKEETLQELQDQDSNDLGELLDLLYEEDE